MNANRSFRNRTHRRSAAAIGLVTSLVPGLAVLSSASTAAAAWHEAMVTNVADDGTASSLRFAIHMANAAGGDWIIKLEAGQTYTLDRDCQDGDLDDNHGGDLDLTGDGTYAFQTTGAAKATIVVACAGERVIDHHGAGELRIDRIRITGGNTARGANGVQAGNKDGGDAEPGGAIRSVGELVYLSRSILDGNRTGDGGSGAPPLFAGPGGHGGDGGVGGAIYATKILVSDSRVTGNTTGTGGNGGNSLGVGNVGGHGGHGGTGTLAAFDVELRDATVDGNVLGNGGNGGAGLGAASPGGAGGDGGSGGGVFTTTLTMRGSTLEANTAGNGGKGGSGNGITGGDGGDGGSAGGAWAPVATIRRSTVHGNAAGLPGAGGNGAPAGHQGGLGTGGGLVGTGAAGVDIAFTTVTSNIAGAAANLSLPAASTLTASIVADPQGGGANCSAFLTSGGGNATDSASCGLGAADQFVPGLALSPIGDHGGDTRTRMPEPGGPLDGSIPVADCLTHLGDDDTDQRGEPRPVGDCEPGATELATDGASAYLPLPPARVFDTREPGPYAGYVGAGETRTVRFAGVAGVPATGVTAVAFNLTLDETAGPEYVTVSPTGRPRPFTSSVNAAHAGQTIPNLVVVPLGTNGQVDFFVQRGAHLVADVVGYFTPARAGTRAGRIVPSGPARAFDTRTGDGGYLAAGGRRDLKVTGIAGVPETGVAAVVINLTGTEAGDAGYFTMWPTGTPQPFTASLNLTRPHHTAGNMTIVPVGDGGMISIYSQSGAHLIGDITGWVTDDSAAYSTAGLFVPLSPTRWFDTREPAPAPGYLDGGTSRDVPVPLEAGVPAWAAAVLFNLTATDPAEPGFITGWAMGQPMPTASSLNLDDGVLRGNAALLRTGWESAGVVEIEADAEPEPGEISFFSNMGAHLVADVYGYLLSDPDWSQL